MTYPLTQSYTYDSLNRLSTAVETSNSSSTWKQKFTYDRYGNRRFDFANGDTTVPASNCTEAICNPTINASTNRLTSTGYSYDASGNTTFDASLRKFTYDAENKQSKVENKFRVVCAHRRLRRAKVDGDRVVHADRGLHLADQLGRTTLHNNSIREAAATLSDCRRIIFS